MSFFDVYQKAVDANGIFNGSTSITASPFGAVGSGVHYTGRVTETSEQSMDLVASGLDTRFDDITYYNQI